MTIISVVPVEDAFLLTVDGVEFSLSGDEAREFYMSVQEANLEIAMEMLANLNDLTGFDYAQKHSFPQVPDVEFTVEDLNNLEPVLHEVVGGVEGAIAEFEKIDQMAREAFKNIPDQS